MLERAYRRLGPRYITFATVGLFPFCAVSNIVGAWALTIVSRVSTAVFVKLLAEALACTAFSIAVTFFVVRPRLRPMFAWLDGDRSAETAEGAWNAFPGNLANIVAIGIVVFSVDFAWYPFELVHVMHAPAWSWIVYYAGVQVAIWWAAVLAFLWIETASRPIARDLATALPENFQPKRTPSTQTKLFASGTILALSNSVFIGATATLGTTGPVRLALLIATGIIASASVSALGNFFLTRSLGSSVHALTSGVARVDTGDLTTMVPRLSADEFGDLTFAFNKMVRGLAERQALQSALGSYIDPIIAERLLAEGELLRSEEVDATVLFLDIRGFTTISERLEPVMIVRYLNMFFARIVPIVSSHGGHVNRFTGDGLVAVFGTPEHLEDHADQAVGAAREIARIADELYGAASMIGIGLNSGRVIAGTVGGGGHLEFTVMGDVVNVSSRVQEHTKTTQDTILITEETRSRLRSEVSLVPRGPTSVRGRSGTVEVFAVPFREDELYGWEEWRWDETLFAGTAPYYERGRLPYAPGLADAMRDALGLDGSGRLLDVGCGPGTVALRVAQFFSEVVGLDADEGMLAEAETLATARDVRNARWVRMRAEDLPGELGTFDVITFAASFHWLDRERVAAAVKRMLRPGGAVVQIDAPAYRHAVGAISNFEHPLVPHHEIVELRKRYLGPHQRAGRSYRNTSPSGEDEIFRSVGFLPAETVTVRDGRILDRSIDEVVANVLSSSSTAPHLFAERLGRFETDLRAMLAEQSPSGLFSVALPSNRLHIWRLA